SSNVPLATASFTVTPIPVVITATATTDKPSYDLGDTAHITAAIAYASGPAALTNATATITVTNGATKATTFATLAIGATATATLDQPITAVLAPGEYTVTVLIRDNTGATLTQQSSTFTIISTAVSGKGVTGTLAADASVTQGNLLTLTATITNNGNAAITSAPFTVQIGADTIPFTATVAIGATIMRTLTYATAALAPATYAATLSSNVPLATASFIVTPIPVVITATATTDKLSYDVGDTAHITAAIAYASGPAALTNATATITVTNGATKTTTFATLAVGATATATLDQPITATTAPGTSTVTILIRDSNGVMLTQQSSTFTIISTAVSGKGVTGTVIADATVTQGNPLALTATITNNGNAALTNAPFAINIVEPSTQHVVDTLTFTATVAAGSSVVQPLTYATTSTLGVQTYSAALFSRITPAPVQLASTTFTVRTSAQFALNVAAGTTPRVIIRTDCTAAGGSRPCVPARLPFLTQTLDAAGIPSVVVGDDTSLLAALRTGAFSAAIIDLPPANEPKIGDEYLELIRSGFGLLFIDDTPDANPKLAPALQTKFGGKLHGPQQLDLLATPFTAAGRITFNGDSSSLELNGSLAAARITATQVPAITYAAFGAGRVVVLPFNVELTPTADVAKLVTAATSWISRAPSTDARQVVPLEVSITTPAGGGPIRIDARVTLPTGMSIVAASPALTSAAAATWTFTASASTTTKFVLWVRLPETLGAYDVTAAVGFSGQLPTIAKTTTLTVAADRAAIENALIARVAALQTTAGAKDGKTLADLRVVLDSIRNPTNANAVAIIDKLLGVINDLDRLSLDAAAARADAERLLVYWQSRA
ncbi:MAG: Carboxypeptidase regulatory-like protein, partial [Acidobacteria bacterium]|nr:Carboxypeptidase regulatory-like protein [Acidobacteriota bacterium]